MLSTDYEDHKSSDTDETQADDHLKGGIYPSPSPSAVIEELNNKLFKLEEWKKEIGIPALKDVEDLKANLIQKDENEIMLNSEILAVRQENQSLQLTIDEYENEHYKLGQDKTELLSTLGELELEASVSRQEEEHWAKSVEQQYHKIDKLNRERRRSHSDLQIHQRTISELLEENSTLKSKIDEMTLLNDKNRQTIADLNEKLKELNIKHNDLKKKHQELGLQYLTEKEKAQNIYIGQYIAQQLNGSEGSISHRNGSNSSPNSSNSTNGAIPVLFNPKTSSAHGSNQELLHGIGSSVMGSNPGSHQSLQIDKLSNASMSPKFEFIRRRSRSFDSEKSHERLMGIHMEHNFDEKEAFDLDHHDVDEEKLRHEIELDLRHGFQREKQEMNDKYDTLQRKYDQLKSKYDRERNPRNRSFILDPDDTDNDSSDHEHHPNDNPVLSRHDLMQIRARTEEEKMKQESKKENCWYILPWNCNK